MTLRLPQLAIERADASEHVDLEVGLVEKVRLYPRRARIEQFAGGDLAAWFVGRDSRVARAKDGEQEILHRRRSIGLAAGDVRLPRHAADPDGQHDERECSSSGRPAMAPECTASDISPASAASL